MYGTHRRDIVGINFPIPSSPFVQRKTTHGSGSTRKARAAPHCRKGSRNSRLISWLMNRASRDDRPQMHMHLRFLRAGLWRTSNKYKLSAQQKLNRTTQNTALILAHGNMGRVVPLMTTRFKKTTPARVMQIAQTGEAGGRNTRAKREAGGESNHTEGGSTKLQHREKGAWCDGLTLRKVMAGGKSRG